jgi:hypothetical protein
MLELSHAQKVAIRDDGFVLVPGVVPRIMCDRALREINHSVGEGMNVADMPILRSQSYCPEITGEPVIRDLLAATPAWQLAESAIGAGRIRAEHHGQIALRFPGLQDPPGEPRPHIDGMYTPTNGVPKGQINNFTALLAVFLSDLSAPYSGNFTVWPGSHLLNAAYFREHGPQSLLHGMPEVDLPPAHQVIARAGDIALVHYLVSHGVAPNVSPHVRYAIFFRLTHVDHEAQKWESMSAPWLQWEGMREVVQS